MTPSVAQQRPFYFAARGMVESAAAGASAKENPRRTFATGSAGLAWIVRGSSQRIMIMRFRPANISLINRRHYLPRLLLTLSSKRQKQKQPHQFADVDRVTPYQCPDSRPSIRNPDLRSLFDALPQKLERRVLSVNHSSFPVLEGDKE